MATSYTDPLTGNTRTVESRILGALVKEHDTVREYAAVREQMLAEQYHLDEYVTDGMILGIFTKVTVSYGESGPVDHWPSGFREENYEQTSDDQERGS